MYERLDFLSLLKRLCAKNIPLLNFTSSLHFWFCLLVLNIYIYRERKRERDLIKERFRFALVCWFLLFLYVCLFSVFDFIHIIEKQDNRIHYKVFSKIFVVIQYAIAEMTLRRIRTTVHYVVWPKLIPFNLNH